MNSIERLPGKGDGRVVYICKMAKEINGEQFTGFEKKQDILMKGQDVCTQVFEDEEDLIKLNQLTGQPEEKKEEVVLGPQPPMVGIKYGFNGSRVDGVPRHLVDKHTSQQVPLLDFDPVKAS
jgi:hypothetical protein